MKSFNRWPYLYFLTSMNNRLFCILLVICGLLLTSLLLMNGKLLLLAVPFLAYLFIGALQAPTDISLTASRFIDQPSVTALEYVQNRLSITNNGNSLVDLTLRDSQFPSLKLLHGQRDQRITMPSGQTIELAYVFKAERGLYTWKSLQACASDSFGLFEIKKELPAKAELAVRPESMRLDRAPLMPQFTLHTPGLIPVHLSGSSTDFLGVREYQTGDPLRRLNWRLAARHPRQVFTNEYEREEIADFGLILDARKLTRMDSVEGELFENSIRAAASLSEIFLKDGNRVALLVFGETLESLLPGYGKKQLNRILGCLARAKLGSHISFGYLEYFPTRLFPSRSYLVVISTLGPRDHETYARLRSAGYEVLLISPNPIPSTRLQLHSSDVRDLAIRAAQIERVIELKRLMKLGVHVIDWKVTEPFETVLQRATRYWVRRRNV